MMSIQKKLGGLNYRKKPDSNTSTQSKAILHSPEYKCTGAFVKKEKIMTNQSK